jgi:hypothetical protein
MTPLRTAMMVEMDHPRMTGMVRQKVSKMVIRVAVARLEPSYTSCSTS